MDVREINELLRTTFPFWDKLGEIDKETFINSSYPVSFEKGKNRWIIYA